ncbi:MAG: hypothetical protein WCT14_11345 [Treponemataceae bacterium]
MGFEFLALRVGLAFSALLFASLLIVIVKTISPVQSEVVGNDSRASIDTVDNKKCA